MSMQGNLEKEYQETQKMGKTLAMLIKVTGTDIKAPKPLRDGVVKKLGLKENKDFAKIESIFNGIEDKKTKKAIMKAIVCTQLTPSEHIEFRNVLFAATQKIRENRLHQTMLA